jgi:predicted nicotinamide N-methyase
MFNQTEIKAYGLKVPLPNHQKVRKLKSKFKPSCHGYKVWDSSWLLVDYLNHSRIVSGKNILDLGCGWGLAGIYCAKYLNASVTCVDIDDMVYPYLNLMAEINHVEVRFLNSDMNQIPQSILKKIDIIIGSDICFCDTLIDPLRDLVKKAEASLAERMIICDPGRWPFDDWTAYYARDEKAEVIEWATNTPSNFAGKILKIECNRG